MSWDAMEWAHNLRIGLSPTEKVTLMVLADHADREGANAYPSVETISREAEISERSVQRALSSLTQRKIIVSQPGGGRSRTTRYSMAMHSLRNACAAEEVLNKGADLAELPHKKDVSLSQSNSKTMPPCPINTASMTPKQLNEQQGEERKVQASCSTLHQPTKDRGSRLSLDWKPDPSDVAFALDLGLDPSRTAAVFRDH